jgi:hypothetical protein
MISALKTNVSIAIMRICVLKVITMFLDRKDVILLVVLVLVLLLFQFTIILEGGG